MVISSIASSISEALHPIDIAIFWRFLVLSCFKCSRAILIAISWIFVGCFDCKIWNVRKSERLREPTPLGSSAFRYFLHLSKSLSAQLEFLGKLSLRSENVSVKNPFSSTESIRNVTKRLSVALILLLINWSFSSTRKLSGVGVLKFSCRACASTGTL